MKETEDRSNKRYQPIADYGVIGNLNTVSLVSMMGSIDFLSFVRFDSPTIFARLLDYDKGGYFSIVPLMDGLTSKQMYLPDTNVLLTRFFDHGGIAELTDFMPVNENEFNCAVLRHVHTIRGNIKYRMEFRPRFGYAKVKHEVKKEKDGLLFIPEGDEQTPVRLVATVPIEIDEQDGYAEFELSEGESAYFIMEAENNTQYREGSTIKEWHTNVYKSTINYWKNWIGKCNYKGRWMDMVHRSALTLKLLFSYQFGSVVAAPTFGLPEVLGGERNWDYRYTWIRDAAFTMYAFLRLGFVEEAGAFIEWIKGMCKEKSLQLMYGIDGEEKLAEKILDHLEGYKRSKPVRIGNAAYKQFQMDIFGELIDTIYIYNKHGMAITYDLWQEVCKHVDTVIKKWKKPDHGIWEIRTTEREFLSSRLMSWVAIDRAIKIADNRSFPYPLVKWHEVRNEIFEDIYKNFWSEKKQAFVQYKGADIVDASALLMPLMRFLSSKEERWKSTLKAIDEDLRLDVLVYRYLETGEDIDGLDGDEGTFTICSFWYIECLSKAGQVERARENFEKMLGYANHLGLYSEQLGVRGEHLGNFPQAFTHLALISAALELDKALERQDGS